MAATLTAATALAACATPQPEPASTPSASADLAAPDRAEEVDAPQRTVVAVDADGAVTVVDVASGDAEPVGEVPGATAIATDGRLVALSTPDGATIVDGGAWTVPHGDHAHSYVGTPRVLGTLDLESPVRIASSATTTIVVGADGRIVALDPDALDDGELAATDLATLAPGAVASVVGGHVVAASDGAVGLVDAGALAPLAACTDPRDAVATRVGAAVLCAEGAVLVTVDGPNVAAEPIPMPDGAPAPASLTGRGDRPTVAGLAADGASAWMLDTRARTWTLVPTGAATQVAAVGDDAERLVVVRADGTLAVLDATDAELAGTSGVDPQHPIALDADRAFAIAADGAVAIDLDDGEVTVLAPDATLLAVTG
ncbi:hypothetical protein [Agrococcus jejuensis]|uniref:ABC transporter n=1 Tax=Agrococcus jejuensis TaxID=399736 RepID=A0A1G8ECN6_9MICO|nr:hypothetical protein [Agrococcus jejuensis]SDH67510.1 hypothetical protein SAMN04489720_1977 [Agrococcus jejuensis]